MSVRKLWSNLGPAWLISAVACGPATLISVMSAGSRWGFPILFVVLTSVLFGTVAQLLSVEAGIRKGGLIKTVRTYLGSSFSWILAIDALLATWLASAVLMNSLVQILGSMTGFKSPLWALIIAGPLYLGAGTKGYRFFERICKCLVIVVVLSFIPILFTWKPGVNNLHDTIGSVSLLGDKESTFLIAAIMGGAVHITIIVMHTYNLHFREWTYGEKSLARTDTLLSMGVFFGLYSMLLFALSALIFHPMGIIPQKASDIGALLRPLAGQSAELFFSAGLLGAAFTTFLPTVLGGAYILADQIDIPLDDKDRKFRFLLGIGFAISITGAFLPGGIFKLLPLMLACGLAGTPLVLLILIYLLAGPLKAEDLKLERKPTSLLLLVMGGIMTVLTSILAVRFFLNLSLA